MRGWRVAPGSGFSVENGREYGFLTGSKISRVYLGNRGPLGLSALCRKYVSVGSLES